jgi:ABC-type enterochelin transport system substrate-binding protein
MRKYQVLFSNLFYVVLLLFFNHTQASAQQSNSDSLEVALVSAKDTARVNLLNKLSTLYVKKNPKKSLAYGEEALTLSRELTYLKA